MRRGHGRADTGCYGPEQSSENCPTLSRLKTHVCWLGTAPAAMFKSQQGLQERTCRLSRRVKAPFDWLRRVLQERLCPCSCRVTSCIRSNAGGVPNRPISRHTEPDAQTEQTDDALVLLWCSNWLNFLTAGSLDSPPRSLDMEIPRQEGGRNCFNLFRVDLYVRSADAGSPEQLGGNDDISVIGWKSLKKPTRENKEAVELQSNNKPTHFRNTLDTKFVFGIKLVV